MRNKMNREEYLMAKLLAIYLNKYIDNDTLDKVNSVEEYNSKTRYKYSLLTQSEYNSIREFERFYE